MRQLNRRIAFVAIVAGLVVPGGCIPPGGGTPTTTSTSTTTTIAPPPWLEPGCLGTDAGLDFKFVGPEGVAGNLLASAPADGNCTGTSVLEMTLVRADTKGEAEADCVAAGFAAFANPSSHSALALPADAWMCSSAVADPSPGDPPVYEGCHDSTTPTPSFTDIYMNGRLNVLNNASWFVVSGPTFASSSDGTCTGYSMAPQTIVTGAALTEAITTCEGLDPSFGDAISLTDIGYDDPAGDKWMCSWTA